MQQNNKGEKGSSQALSTSSAGISSPSSHPIHWQTLMTVLQQLRQFTEGVYYGLVPVHTEGH